MTTPAPRPPRPPSPEAIEAFLDGRLAGPEAASVEQAIARDPGLAHAAALQSRIDQSLRRRFSPEDVALPAPRPIPLGSRISPPRWALVAAAAVVLLGIGAATWLAMSRPESGPEGVYHRLQAANFKPAWKCETDADFVQFMHYRFGNSFLVKSDPGVGLIGWVYVKDVLSPHAAALMATVDGDHSVVVVDRMLHDQPLTAAPRSGLHVFRREFKSLVLYEITPLPAPRVLDLVYAPPEGPAAGDQSSH